MKKQPKYIKTKAKMMLPFIDKCKNAGISPNDISNLSLIAPKDMNQIYETLHRLSKNKNVGINKVSEWANEIECFERISYAAVTNVFSIIDNEKERITLESIQREREEKEREENTKELIELAKSMGIEIKDLINAMKNK